MTQPRDPSTPAAVSEPYRHRWIWGVYGVLFALSVPWYLPRTETPPLWWGVPYWVVLSLVAISGVAVFTAWVVHRFWDDGTPLEEDGEP